MPADVRAPQTILLWHHPERGAILSVTQPRTAQQAWTAVAEINVRRRDKYNYKIVAGQSLPRGFLWGDPNKQTGGSIQVYGPIERRCSDCREVFSWPARAQKHFYEIIGATVHATAKRCRFCVRRHRAREAARLRYADSIRMLKMEPTAAHYLAAAKSALEILHAGGRVAINRAIGFCTRARKLGEVEAAGLVATELRKLRRKHMRWVK